jgi:prepilin-type N-terminal cleavage/methylation domain-containing protein
MRFSKQAGFSLVEILVSVAILAGAGFMLMQQQDITTKTKQKMNSDQEVDAFVNQIKRTMSEQQNCSVTLKDKKIGDTISKIKLGDMLIEPGFASPDFGANYPASYLDRPFFEKTIYQTGSEYGNTRIKIKEMKLVQVKDPVTGSNFLDALQIKFSSKTPPLKEEKETHRNIYIMGTKEAGKYVRCASESLGVIEQSMAQACKALEAEFNPVTKRCELKNLPKTFMVEKASECGTVYTTSGTMLVEQIVLEMYKCTHYFKKKKWPLWCRLYGSYNTTCSCGEGVACACPAPGPRTCRRLDRTECVPDFTTKPTLLTKCVRQKLPKLGLPLNGNPQLPNLVPDGGSTTGSTYAGAGSGGCFVAGTKVSLPDNQSKNIEDVISGDELLDGTGKSVIVKSLHRYSHQGLIYGFNGGRQFFTANHPFLTLEGWKSLDPKKSMSESLGLKVKMLQEGDVVIKQDGNLEAIFILNSTYSEETVYNFTVSGNHQYIADEYVVHNLEKLRDDTFRGDTSWEQQK